LKSIARLDSTTSRKTSWEKLRFSRRY